MPTRDLGPVSRSIVRDRSPLARPNSAFSLSSITTINRIPSSFAHIDFSVQNGNSTGKTDEPNQVRSFFGYYENFFGPEEESQTQEPIEKFDSWPASEGAVFDSGQ